MINGVNILVYSYMERRRECLFIKEKKYIPACFSVYESSARGLLKTGDML